MAKKENERFVKLFEKHLKKYELQWHDVKLNSDRKRKLDSIFERVANAFETPLDNKGRRARFDRIINGEEDATLGLKINLNEIFGEKVFYTNIDYIKKHLGFERSELDEKITNALNAVATCNAKISDTRGTYFLEEEVINGGSTFLVDVAKSACDNYENESYYHAGVEFGRLAEGLIYLIDFCQQARNKQESDASDKTKVEQRVLKHSNKREVWDDELVRSKQMRNLVHFNAVLRKLYHDKNEDRDNNKHEISVKSVLKFCKNLCEVLTMETEKTLKSINKEHNKKPKGAKNARRKK